MITDRRTNRRRRIVPRRCGELAEIEQAQSTAPCRASSARRERCRRDRVHFGNHGRAQRRRDHASQPAGESGAGAGEIAKYQKYAGRFCRFGILNLLPLSHLFGQSLALFIPPLVPASVVFMTGYQRAGNRAADQIAAHLRAGRGAEDSGDSARFRGASVSGGERSRAGRGPWPLRWWRFRRVHRLFGWKFWASSPAARRFRRTLNSSGRSLDSWWCKATGSPKPRPSSR